MYARGILFGKMKYELGDHAVVRCPETGLEADIEFKVKGWVGGTYNAIGGYIKDSKSGKNLFELSGLWHDEMFIKDLTTGKKESHTFKNEGHHLCQENAEWIVEDFEEGKTLIPFADFHHVTFTDAHYTDGSGTHGTAGATVLDIRQEGQVLTQCSIPSSDSVHCSYK